MPTDGRFRGDEGWPSDLDPGRHRTAIEGVGQRDLYGGGGWARGRGVATIDVVGRDEQRVVEPRLVNAPRGYRRSDERILDEVCERLTEDDAIDASDVEVTVKDGDVTLAGTVPDRAMKLSAELICGSVRGVVDITNLLRIRRP